MPSGSLKELPVYDKKFELFDSSATRAISMDFNVLSDSDSVLFSRYLKGFKYPENCQSTCDYDAIRFFFVFDVHADGSIDSLRMPRREPCCPTLLTEFEAFMDSIQVLDESHLNQTMVLSLRVERNKE